MSCDGEWCNVKKFSGNQLRATSYKVQVSECYRVPSEKMPSRLLECCDSDQESENECESIPEQRGFAIPSVPPVLTQPEVLPDIVECVPILISEPALPTGSPPLTPAKCPPC